MKSGWKQITDLPQKNAQKNAKSEQVTVEECIAISKTLPDTRYIIKEIN